MKEKLDETFTAMIPQFPKQVTLKLPKLKKLGENKTKLPNLQLPKLKKLGENKEKFPKLKKVES